MKIANPRAKLQPLSDVKIYVFELQKSSLQLVRMVWVVSLFVILIYVLIETRLILYKLSVLRFFLGFSQTNANIH